jgi:hypothetical protein
MTLQVFFDESGKLADQEMVVFGGCLLTTDHSVVMSERWTDALKESGLSYMSMKDAMNFRGEFENWKKDLSRDVREAERDALLVRMVSTADYDVKAYPSAGVSTSDFKTLPDEQRKRLKDPQYCAFEACMNRTIHLVHQADFLHIYCDSTENYAKECIGLYHKLRMRDAEFRKRCVAITFAEDEAFPPLQFADVVAYCVRKQKTDSSQVPPVVKDILAIIQGRGAIDDTLTYLLGGEGLGHGVFRRGDDQKRRT